MITIFLAKTDIDARRRIVSYEIGRDPSTHEAAGGFEAIITGALKALTGQPVVQMTADAPEIGEVLEVTEAGKRLTIRAAITSSAAWRKAEGEIYRGARIRVYGQEVPYAGSLMLSDCPAPEDVILRAAALDNDAGLQRMLSMDFIRASIRDQQRVHDHARAVIAEARDVLARYQRIAETPAPAKTVGSYVRFQK